MRRPGAGIPVRLPPYAAGMRIGLYGGSFDPPHPGHRHVATTALRRLGLDRVWWLVTPGNPLKDRGRVSPLAERLAATLTVASHPRMAATAVEAVLGMRFTVETLRYLVRRCPGVRFVLIVGGDSFANLPRWRAWREILRLIPVVAVDRPGWTLEAGLGRVARTFPAGRVPEAAAASLPLSRPPAWTILYGRRSSLSSTLLRAGRSSPARGR